MHQNFFQYSFVIYISYIFLLGDVVMMWEGRMLTCLLTISKLSFNFHSLKSGQSWVYFKFGIDPQKQNWGAEKQRGTNLSLYKNSDLNNDPILRNIEVNLIFSIHMTKSFKDKLLGNLIAKQSTNLHWKKDLAHLLTKLPIYRKNKYVYAQNFYTLVLLLWSY